MTRGGQTRATDAVLVQLDALAEGYNNLLFVATSNFPQAVDGAFLSRCDLIMPVPLPDRVACAQILKDCLAGLGRLYPAIARLAAAPQFEECAAACVGLDGRAIRKMRCRDCSHVRNAVIVFAQSSTRFAVEAATLVRGGPPRVTRLTLPTCRAHYPGGPNGCACVYSTGAGDGGFWTDTEQIKYHVRKAGLMPSEAGYRLLLQNKPGRLDVTG